MILSSAVILRTLRKLTELFWIHPPSVSPDAERQNARRVNKPRHDEGLLSIPIILCTDNIWNWKSLLLTWKLTLLEYRREEGRIESSIMTHLLQGRCKIHVLRLLIIPYGQTGKYLKIHFVYIFTRLGNGVKYFF